MERVIDFRSRELLGVERQHLGGRQIFRIEFPLPFRVLKTRGADPRFHKQFLGMAGMCCARCLRSLNLRAMKRMFVWLVAVSLSLAPLVRAQDPDPDKQSDEQLKEASKQASEQNGAKGADGK